MISKSAWNSGLSRKRPIPSSEHHTSSWPWASQWFALRNTVSHGATAAEQLDSFRHVQQGLLPGSGTPVSSAPGTAGRYASAGLAGDDRVRLRRCWWYRPTTRGRRRTISSISGCRRCTTLVCRAARAGRCGLASIVSDGLFGADHAPRFIILVGLHEWLCSIASSGPTAAPCALTGARFSTARTRSPCRPRPRYCTGTRWLLTAAAPVC